jgi:uncharacterized protein YodC (DUF2158 family)
MVFEPGDVVRLKNIDGPDMVVEQTLYCECYCVWFAKANGGRNGMTGGERVQWVGPHRSTFHQSLLELARQPPQEAVIAFSKGC